jgi:hypothetical protein
MTASTASTAPPVVTARPGATTRRLLVAGVAAGPLFIGSGLAQAFTRDGFDLRVNALSQLALGDLGFLQVGTFLATGVLLLAAGEGVRRCGSTWLGVLVALHGVGMIIAGVFRTDPSYGYPAGAPAGMPAELSTAGVLHGVGFFLAMVVWTLAAFVAARRFLRHGERGWAAACALAPVAAAVLFAVPAFGPTSIRIAEAATLQFALLGAICAKLVRETSR